MDLAKYVDPETGLFTGADGGRDDMPVVAAVAIFVSNDPIYVLKTAQRVLLFLEREDINLGWGIFRRYPGANDNSMDNMVAACFVSPEFAKSVLAGASMTEWCFNVRNPLRFSVQDFYGRFIGFIPFVKACAEADLNRVNIFLSSVACLYSTISPYGDTTNKILQMLMNVRLRGRDKWLDRAINEWCAIMQRRYPKGPKELLGLYYGIDHPITLEAAEVFK